MKTIYLLRHAKSGWTDSEAEDFARPLNLQGQRDAIQIGRYFSHEKIEPDVILCSAATRAKETLSYMRPFLPETQAIQIEDSLYLSSSETLMQHLEAVNESANSVLIIAHNPGLHELAINLAGRENIGISNLLNQILQRFPSGALTTVENNSDQWKTLNQGESTLVNFICPTDLPLLKE